MKDAQSGIYFVQKHYPIPSRSMFYGYLFTASYMDGKDVDWYYIREFKSPIS